MTQNWNDSPSPFVRQSALNNGLLQTSTGTLAGGSENERNQCPDRFSSSLSLHRDALTPQACRVIQSPPRRSKTPSTLSSRSSAGRSRPYPGDVPTDMIVRVRFPTKWTVKEDAYSRSASAFSQNGDAEISVSARAPAEVVRPSSQSFLESLREELQVRVGASEVVQQPDPGPWIASWSAQSADGRYYAQTVSAPSTASSWALVCEVEAPDERLAEHLTRACWNVAVQFEYSSLRNELSDPVQTVAVCGQPAADLTTGAAGRADCPAAPSYVVQSSVARERSGGRIEIQLYGERDDASHSDGVLPSEAHIELNPGKPNPRAARLYNFVSPNDERPFATLCRSAACNYSDLYVASRIRELDNEVLPAAARTPNHHPIHAAVFSEGRGAT